MNTLLEKLEKAHEICQNANQYLEKSNDVQERKQLFISKFECAPLWQKLIYYALTFQIFDTIISAVINLFFASVARKSSFITATVCITLYILTLRLIKKFVIEPIKNKQVNKYDKEISTYNGNAEQIFTENAEYLEFLPVDYWYPLATEYLIKIVGSGRCTDLSEALDKFDEQLHRWKLENANAEIIAQQQIQIANLESIRRSNNVNAAANVFNAFVNLNNSL